MKAECGLDRESLSLSIRFLIFLSIFESLFYLPEEMRDPLSIKSLITFAFSNEKVICAMLRLGSGLVDRTHYSY